MKKPSKARKFVNDFWFDKDKPSKAVSIILEWIVEGRLTNKGKEAYKKLIKNVED